MLAMEAYSCEQALGHLPEVKHRAEAVLRRISRIARLPEHPSIVDVGSAQGNFLVACASLGYTAIGVEPWAAARALSNDVAERTGVEIRILDGSAEALPLQSNAYDIVHANSVIEHVVDVRAAFREAYRVLKPGGVFWFSAASSLCPAQMEIRGFPAFGWYPNALKLRVMSWAVENKPELIGHTTRPAVHWFTPWKARRLLHDAGFSRVYDRWDLRLPDEGGRLYRRALAIIRFNALTKFAADVAVKDCSYAAVK